MTWIQCFMLWLDFNAVVGVYLYHKFGWSGIVDLQQSLIERLMRGVHGK